MIDPAPNVKKKKRNKVWHGSLLPCHNNRFCATKVCLFVALNIQVNNIIPENTPHSVAAGIVYFVSQSCNLNITKRDVNNCSEISEVTINKCYKKLEKIKEQLIPKVILEKYAK